MIKAESKLQGSLEELLEIICCPICKGELLHKKPSNLICNNCDQSFLIQDEIPILIAKEDD